MKHINEYSEFKKSLCEKSGPCWDGYKIGSPKTKISSQSGKRVNNCVPIDEEVNEKLARGLKPLLKLGSTITKKTGEDALLDLSDKFDSIDDEYAGTIASHLDMAIELMQDGYAGDATKKLKQFNKACKDVLNGKDVGSAFESTVTEAKGGQIMPGDYVKNQHGNIYQRVDGKVGRHDAYVRVTNGKSGKRKTGLHDSFKLTLVNKYGLEESVDE